VKPLPVGAVKPYVRESLTVTATEEVMGLPVESVTVPVSVHDRLSGSCATMLTTNAPLGATTLGLATIESIMGVAIATFQKVEGPSYVNLAVFSNNATRSSNSARRPKRSPNARLGALKTLRCCVEGSGAWARPRAIQSRSRNISSSPY
jgi:hypothetical protein